LQVFSNGVPIRNSPSDESNGSSVDPDHSIIRGEGIDSGSDQRFPSHEKEGDAHQKNYGPTDMSGLGTDLEAVPE